MLVEGVKNHEDDEDEFIDNKYVKVYRVIYNDIYKKYKYKINQSVNK